MLFFHVDTAYTDDTADASYIELKVRPTLSVCVSESVIDACQDCQTVWAINQSTVQTDGGGE